MDGFYTALTMRPDAWLEIAEGSEAHDALAMLMRMAQLATTPLNELEAMEGDDLLEKHAPDLIPELVQDLHHARKQSASSQGFPVAANQNWNNVGRNDPCPCGSGKKYKKCCLQ